MLMCEVSRETLAHCFHLNLEHFLFAKVALGKTAELTKIDPSLTAPPSGYDSVHGVRFVSVVN